MSKIYEALTKAGNGTKKARQSQAEITAFRIVKNNNRRPKIDLDLEPIVEEQYQKLRMHLLPGPKRSSVKVIMIAATGHGEGGTTTAAILASTLAKSKNCKILLVDANLRTPALDSVFNGQINNSGLSDLVMSQVALDDSIYSTNLPNLFILPCGKPVPSPSYIFDGEPLTDLLNTLRERFDYVIFDASPLHGYSESLFLASKVDGVILVVEAERTKREVVRRVAKDLEASGVNLLGMVLNKKRKYIPEFLERFL